MASIRPHYNSEGKLTSFYIRVSNGRDANGKIKNYSTKTFQVPPTLSENAARKQAEICACEFEAQCKAGKISNNKQTFAEYCDDFINAKELAEEIRHTTAYNYRELTKLIYPIIGDIKLSKLTKRDLEQLYAKLSKTENKNYKSKAVPKNKFADLLKQKNITRKALSELSGVALHTVAETVNGKETSVQSAQAIADALEVNVQSLFKFTTPESHKLSGTTVNACHRLIKTVLKEAVDDGVIPYSVADRIKKPPRKDHKEPVYYDIEQILKIRQEIKFIPLKWQTMMFLFLCTGCRRGEICALTWDAVDLDAKQIDIRASLNYVPEYGVSRDDPKTESSKRKLAISEEMVEQLKKYKEWQEREKDRLDDLYQDEGYLFTQDKYPGQPINPGTVNNWMKKLDECCGFHVRPHAFRHSTVSVLLFEGLDIVAISKYLGHADISITLKIYAHLIEKANERPATIMSDVVFSKDAAIDSDE